VGLDEETGILNDAPNGLWQVYGKGRVTIYKGDQIVSIGPEEGVPLA
jgi:hypothetical protein